MITVTCMTLCSSQITVQLDWWKEHLWSLISGHGPADGASLGFFLHREQIATLPFASWCTGRLSMFTNPKCGHSCATLCASIQHVVRPRDRTPQCAQGISGNDTKYLVLNRISNRSNAFMTIKLTVPGWIAMNWCWIDVELMQSYRLSFWGEPPILSQCCRVYWT